MKLAILVLCVALLATLPFTYAEPSSTYTIALEGGRWTRTTITVKIPQTPAEAHEAVIWAMETWNWAQEWFTKTYYSNNSVRYTFVEANSSANVQFHFQTTLVRCGAELASGCTKLSNGIGIAVTLDIAIMTGSSQDAAIEGIAEHEFGHVLGLGHTTIEDDLMCAPTANSSCSGTYIVNGRLQNAPSTLDLYAVHILAITNRLPAKIMLPSNIPYVQWAVQPVPELTSNAIVFISALASASLAVGLRRKCFSES
jgi:hypothetical protein